MPSKKWFAENPKVSAYIPKELNNLLLQWKKEHRVKSSSRALILILSEFLGLPEDAGQVSEAMPISGKLEALEARIAAIEERLEGEGNTQGELPGLSDFFKSAHKRHYQSRSTKTGDRSQKKQQQK